MNIQNKKLQGIQTGWDKHLSKLQLIAGTRYFYGFHGFYIEKWVKADDTYDIGNYRTD